MTHITRRYVLAIGLAAAGWFWNGEILPIFDGDLVTTAEARIGRPVTPVSYAGVARVLPLGWGRGVLGFLPESELALRAQGRLLASMSVHEVWA